MLERANFIICPKQKMETEVPWRTSKFNSRSWTLADKGGIPCFRKIINIEEDIETAVISCTALGIFEIYVNGQRVGADELKPGFTDYRKTVYGFDYDIKDYLKVGKNTIIAEVSLGWYSGRISFGKFGFLPNAFVAEIKINDDLYVTDEFWEAGLGGAYRNASIYDGVLYDARKNFDDVKWDKPKNTSVDCKVLPAALPYIAVKMVLPAKKAVIYDGITENETTFGEINTVYEKSGKNCERLELKKNNVMLLDFEQNLVGRIHINFKAPVGAKLIIRHAEMLNDSGEKSRGNDYAKGSAYIENYRSAAARVEIISDGETLDFSPYHTFFGFRYVEIECDNDVEINCVEAEVIGNKNEELGAFECSNESVNKLFSNILWGARGNYLSVPTDCPQRDERLGWSGDTQVFACTGAYLCDIEDFMRKWLHDARDSQELDGGYGDVIPNVFKNPDNVNNTGWGDAGIIVPYVLYKMYNSVEILEEHYASMEEYMATIKARKPEGQHNNYGDWLAYEQTEKDYLTFCYYLYDLKLIKFMSEVLGKTERAKYYENEYARVRKNFADKYIEEDKITQKTQTANALALGFGLLDEKQTKIALDFLIQKLADNDYTLSSGFIGTSMLNTALSKHNRDDVAYNLLLCRNDPSWLYSVDQGATTIWERWNSYTIEKGFGDVGMNSFNHYAYGCIAEWMFSYMCGIRPDIENPGFKTLIFDPRPDMREEIPEGREKISFAKAEYKSREGLIKSEWYALENGFEYKLTTPVETKVSVPAVLDKCTLNGRKKDAELIDGKYVFTLKAGEYVIKA